MNDDKLTQIREQLPAVHATAFLNTGSCGPLPAPAHKAIQRVTEQEFTEGRAAIERFMKTRESQVGVREYLAQMFNAAPENFALTHHTTDGMNIGTYGINWQPGDEVATTTIEHEAGLYPLYMVQQRYGVKINFADVHLGEDPLPAIDAALTPKTRLLSLSQVSYSTGARFPMKEIIALAHSKNMPVLLDGAQSAGAFAVDLAALNVDYFALPAQKWLCGPDGIGALYVRPDRLEELHPTYVGYNSYASQDWRGGFEMMPTASRYETGMLYPATILGWEASLKWLLEEVGTGWAFERIAGLAAYTRHKLEALDGVEVITPGNRQASLVNFLPVGWSVARMFGLSAALMERGFTIRSIPHAPYCMRVSCGFYNTEAEIDGLYNALGELLEAGPEALEPPQMALDFGVPDEPLYAPL